MVEEEAEGQQSKSEELKKDIGNILEALRPLTPTPSTDQLPKGVNANQWADMKNLTDLLDIIRGPKQPQEQQKTIGVTQPSASTNPTTSRSK